MRVPVPVQVHVPVPALASIQVSVPEHERSFSTCLPPLHLNIPPHNPHADNAKEEDKEDAEVPRSPFQHWLSAFPVHTIPLAFREILV